MPRRHLSGLLLTLALALVSATCVLAQASPRAPAQASAQAPAQTPAQAVLVLTTLDGGVLGLDAATGSRVFALPGSDGTPAVSSWAAPGRPRYIPGVNGRLFRLRGDGGAEEVDGVFLGVEGAEPPVGKGGGQEVAVPSAVGEGLGVVLKQTKTSVMYIDAESGAVVKELKFDSAGGKSSVGGEDGRGMILLSRTEIGVRVMDAVSGAEVANATITHTTPSLVQGDVCVVATGLGEDTSAGWRGSVDFEGGIVSMSSESGVAWSMRVEEDIIEAHGLGNVRVVRSEKVMEIGDGAEGVDGVSVRGEGKVLYALPASVKEEKNGAEIEKSRRKVGIAELLGLWEEGGSGQDANETDVRTMASAEELLLVGVQEVIYRVVGISVAAGMVMGMVMLLVYRRFWRRNETNGGQANISVEIDSRVSTPASAPLVTPKHYPHLSIDKFVLEGEINEVNNSAGSMGSGGSGSGFGVGSAVPVRSDSGWMTIGSFEVSNNVLGVGSHGTVVYEGRMMPGSRRVAVKRLLRQFYESARKEISLLVELDEASPHVVRYFAMEEDAEFIYLALELCSAPLNARVQSNDAPAPPKSYTTGPLPRVTVRALRQLMQGLADLHRQNIVHRDLKPQNVLCQGANLKLADVGLALRLDADRSSYTAVSNAAGGVGTTGWRAPEVLSGGRQTRAVDVFSAGCIICYVVTSGDHPFGLDIFGRDGKIVSGKPDLQSLASLGAPEALDIVERMIAPKPEDRPSAAEALSHPFFWSDATKLAFLVDISDRLYDLRRDSMRYTERLDESALAVKHCSDWPNRVDEELLGEIGFQYGGAASHVLRVVRNKRNHYSELSPRLQKLLGQLPDDEDKNSFDSLAHVPGEKRQLDEHNFLTYFLRRVPQLLMCVYVHALNYPELVHQPHFARYGFNSSSSHDILPLHPRVARLRDGIQAKPSNGRVSDSSLNSSQDGELDQLSRCYYKRGTVIAMSSESLEMAAETRTIAMEAGVYSKDAGSRWRERLTTGLYELYEDTSDELQHSLEESEDDDKATPAFSPPAMGSGPPPGFGNPPSLFSKPPASFGRPPPYARSPGRTNSTNLGSLETPDVPALGSRLDRKPTLGYIAPGEASSRDWGGLRRGN